VADHFLALYLSGDREADVIMCVRLLTSFSTGNNLPPESPQC
jgi:hypothetical protein